MNLMNKAFISALCAISFLFAEDFPPDITPLEGIVLSEPVKNSQFFVFRPSWSLQKNFDGIGVLYRQYEKNSFYELEALQKRATVVGPSKDWTYTVKRGEVHLNNVTLSKGIATNTPYVRFYALGGGGVMVPYASVGRFKNPISPILTGKVGVEFKYGFIDFGLNVAMPPVSYHVSFESEQNAISKTQNYSVLSASRIGFGFTF